MLHDWPVIAPYVILALAGGLLFCLGAFWRGVPRELLWWLALGAAAAAGLSSLGGPLRGAYLGFLDVGLYGRMLVALCALITLITLLMLRSYAGARNFGGDELYGLVLMAALGMMLTATALNWLLLFLGLQLLSICLYVLIAVRRGSDESMEAGLKYFCLGAAAGAAVIFGIAMIYAAGGSLSMRASLHTAMAQGHGSLALLGLGLLLCGLAFKISLTPLHVWTPDVFQGAPAPITAFLAAGSKSAAAAVLIRICADLPEGLLPYWTPVLWMLAALTMLAANLSALREVRVKRLLAYSSAAQMGYLLMALLAARHGGLSAALFFLVVYSLMDLGVFGLLGMLSARSTDPDHIGALRGLATRNPWLSAFLALCLFSLAGLPPTAGFMGKFFLFRSLISAGHYGLGFLAALAAAAAFYYYFKLIVAMYMEEADREGARPAPWFSSFDRLALGLIAVGLMILGLFPSWLLNLSSSAVGALGM